jgi:hypothetical protein
MGRPLNKKYFGKRNTGAAGTFGNTNLLPTDYDLGGQKALNASIGTAGSYTQAQALALTTTFPKPALASEGAVTAVGTPTFTILTGTTNSVGSQTKAYTTGAGSLSVAYGGVTSTYTPTLTASQTGLAITNITTAGVATISSGTYVVGQDVVVTGVTLGTATGFANGTYYVAVVTNATTITLANSYANAVASSPVAITTVTGSGTVTASTVVVGGTYNTVASVAVVAGGTYTQAGVTAGLAAAQTPTPAVSGGAGLTITPATFGVNGVTYTNTGNGYINTVPVTPSITSSTVTTIASGAYGSITVGATPFNTITLGTAQAAGTFYVGQVVTFTGTASTNFIGGTAAQSNAYATGQSYIVTATNGTSTLTFVGSDGTALSGGAAGAVTGLSIVLYKETVTSTDQLVPGFKVVTTGTGGSLTAGTYYIIAVNGATEIVLSSSVGGSAVVVTTATSTATTVVSGNTAITFGSGSAAGTMTFAAQVTTGYTSNYAAIQAQALATTGGVVRQDTDIIKQENTQRFRVENADGVFYAKLVNALPTVGGTMAINATDSAGGTYWVTKITNRRCRVTRNSGTQFADGSTVNWTFGSPVANVSVKIDNA